MKIQRKQGIILICVLTFVLLALGITAVVLMIQNIEFGFAREVSADEAALRMQIVQTAEGWLGCNEADETHCQIIDIYNSHSPLAQGYIVNYRDNWCAAFGSAVAIQCNLTDIIPTECGCQRQIALFEEMGRWEESDDYVPLPGDYIFYSTKNPSTGECTAWSDHVGIVVGTAFGYIKVIEGNNGSRVAFRYLPINDPMIRGFGLPDYQSKSMDETTAHGFPWAVTVI